MKSDREVVTITKVVEVEGALDELDSVLDVLLLDEEEDEDDEVVVVVFVFECFALVLEDSALVVMVSDSEEVEEALDPSPCIEKGVLYWKVFGSSARDILRP